MVLCLHYRCTACWNSKPESYFSNKQISAGRVAFSLVKEEPMSNNSAFSQEQMVKEEPMAGGLGMAHRTP